MSSGPTRAGSNRPAAGDGRARSGGVPAIIRSQKSAAHRRHLRERRRDVQITARCQMPSDRLAISPPSERRPRRRCCSQASSCALTRSRRAAERQKHAIAEHHQVEQDLRRAARRQQAIRSTSGVVSTSEESIGPRAPRGRTAMRPAATAGRRIANWRRRPSVARHQQGQARQRRKTECRRGNAP